MWDSPRDHESLARAERDGPVLEVDPPSPFDDVEELVRVAVAVPVVLPPTDAETGPGIVDRTEAPGEPGIGTGLRDRPLVRDLEGRVTDLRRPYVPRHAPARFDLPERSEPKRSTRSAHDVLGGAIGYGR